MAHPAAEGKSHKKHRAHPPHEEHSSVDAPFWFISWADLVTLLFGLFVALFSISTLSEEKLKTFLAGIKAHFSSDDGTSAEEALRKKMKIKAPRQGDFFRGDKTEPGPSDQPTLKRGRYESQQDLKRYGSKLVTGGRIDFETDSAELSSAAVTALKEIAATLRGHRTRVEIRGFATGSEISSKRLSETWDLAYARAKAVSDFLTDPEKGNLLPHRVRLVVGGITEPVSSDGVPNQRVEIINTVEFTHLPWHSTHPLHEQWIQEQRRSGGRIVYTQEAVTKLREAKVGMSPKEILAKLGEPEEKRRFMFDSDIFEEWKYPGGTLRFYVHPSGDLGALEAVGLRKGWGFTTDSSDGR